ncbi:transmembrane protein 69-like [Ylistrum balloti]|uniref:transmembrane protein 69-like n=1 Tax=Ylistrum balloti TaxID=509963 RepID=UPI002905D810|nr:transmembrane protein 69-like [Ylistrum balloti]
MLRNLNVCSSIPRRVWIKPLGYGSACISTLSGCSNYSRTAVVSSVQKKTLSQYAINSSNQLVKGLSKNNVNFDRNPKILPSNCILLQRCLAPAATSPYLKHFHEDRKTTALTVLGSLKELKTSPIPALVLGFSGLIPFVAAPMYIVTSQLFLPDIAFAQVVYGATILSFLGGVRWGMTIPENGILRPNWFNLTYSVTPSLVAWAGVLMPSPFSSLTLMLGLAGACYMDMVSYGYPPWFKGLRFTLTFVAILSLWTTLMCSLLMDTDPKKQEKKAE